MSTAQSLIDDVRARVVEASEDFFTDAQILRWLNQGYRNFCLNTYILEKTVGFYVSRPINEFTLPDDCLAVQQVRWKDTDKVYWRDQEEFDRRVGKNRESTDIPEIYTIYPGTTKLKIYPHPSVGSFTTTLDGAVASTSDVSIPVTIPIFIDGVEVTPTPPFKVRVGTEQMHVYSYEADTGLMILGDSGTISGRGDAFTTAATHLTLAPVLELPLWVSYTYCPPAMTTGGSAIDCRLPVWYDEAIICYATAIAFRAKDKYETADRNMKVYKDLMEKAMGEVVKQQRDRLPCIKDEDFSELL